MGLTSLDEVSEEVRRIASQVDVPLLVDGDTGWGNVLNIAYATQRLEAAGAAGVHFEDQSWPKRCGHREGKTLISQDEMCEKLKAATDAKVDKDFVIMARTDALAVEDVEKTKARIAAYLEAGADMIFLEAATTLETYKDFTDAFPNAPFLANITEFGKTPLFTTEELKNAGIKMALYPLSAFRMMNYAAQQAYQTILDAGTQKELLEQMQTRDELYRLLNYQHFEDKVN